MISDPLVTRLQNILGTAGTSQVANYDLIGTGPGTKSARKLGTIPSAWTSLLAKGTCSVEHSVTKAARRRSVLRFDSIGPLDSANGALGTTASAYLVLDTVDTILDASFGRAVVDSVVTALLNALVTSKAANADAVFTASLTDFLGGEP